MRPTISVELHQRAIMALGGILAATSTGQFRATLIDFRAAHMSPERTVIAIAGAFDRAAFIDMAQARFGALAAKPWLLAAPARAHAGAVGEIRKLEQSHLVFSWPAPPAGDDRLYAARLLAEIFGGGMASRLFQEVRETRGLVYAIDAFLETFEDDGRLAVYAGCSGKTRGGQIVQAEPGWPNMACAPMNWRAPRR